ncbi:GIY-YIG nuclease family protein [Pseudomonas chlororaphis]|uniref:GIY-YIG nuclease family protein n=1 Tax=Pseudomonas chlororaphis TaxID=587753 RepID=UPI0023675133|nr:GIY-YIG nuclease family protein [Pseudomonas chlororaphis]WDG45683.1 GIY-YIG nuclease family protein [Pseudomonas chlororaphis]
MNYGFIYCLGNDCMPGVYKIGMTDRAPSQRVLELSGATAAPMPFTLLCFGEVDNALSVERELHQLFAAGRVSASREFFRVDYREIGEAFCGYVNHFCETMDGREHSHGVELMQAFYLARSPQEKVKAVLAAAQFSGTKLWKDGDVIRSSSRLVYSSWITAAISSYRELLLEVLPVKQPVTRLVSLVNAMEASDE